MLALIGTAAFSALVAKEITFPSSNKIGFYVGAFASQLHFPIIFGVLGSLHVFLEPPLDQLVVGVCLISMAVILVDFFLGLRITPPEPPMKYRVPPHSTTQLWMRRTLQMLCPPLGFVVEFLASHVVRNLAYNEVDTGPLHLDIIRMKNQSNDPLPVFLYVHGGGWVTGSKDYIGGLVIHHIIRSGWVAVSINYRLSTLGNPGGATWPDHIVDVKRAIVWVKTNITKYGGDPERIVIAGGSAGGHLAALAALTPNVPEFQPSFEEEDTSVRAGAAMYGVHDFTDEHGQWRAWDQHHGKRHADPSKQPILVSFLQKFIVKRRFEEHLDVYRLASPLFHAARLKGNHVPIFVTHGDRDILVPHVESMLLYSKLNPARSVLFNVPGGHHAFDSLPSPRAFAMLDALDKFLHMDCILDPDSKTQ